MLKRETGAAHVVVCDHTVRRGTIEYATVCLVAAAPCAAACIVLWSKVNTLRQMVRGRVPSATSVTAHGKPVARVHVDYTAGSARDKLTALLPEKAEKLMERPWAIVQVVVRSYRPECTVCGMRGPLHRSVTSRCGSH